MKQETLALCNPYGQRVLQRDKTIFGLYYFANGEKRSDLITGMNGEVKITLLLRQNSFSVVRSLNLLEMNAA